MELTYIFQTYPKSMAWPHLIAQVSILHRDVTLAHSTKLLDVCCGAHSNTNPNFQTHG